MTYLGFFLQSGLVEELEEALDIGKELRLRVRVVHSHGDLRVGLDERSTKITQVLDRIRVILELFFPHRDICCLLKQNQRLNKVELAETLTRIAGNTGKRCDRSEFSVLLPPLLLQNAQEERDEA